MFEETTGAMTQDTPKVEATVETPAAKPAEPAKVAEEAAPPAEPAKEPVKEPAKAEEKGEPAKVVPEKYDLKLPEDSPLDTEFLGKFAELARKQGLTNEEAQAKMEEYSEQVKVEFEERVTKWEDQVRNDKEIGGDGFKESVLAAQNVMKKFGSDDFKQLLNKTGYGSHPEVVRFLTKIGKAMANDSFVMGGKLPGREKSAAEVLYPSTKEN